MFDTMLLRTVRGVDGILPPKMSLLPPPGGLRTLQRKWTEENLKLEVERHENVHDVNLYLKKLDW